MSNLEQIFTDIAQKAMGLGLELVLKRLAGRSLRVATVCSGTESPLLALKMIQEGKLYLVLMRFPLPQFKVRRTRGTIPGGPR